MILLQNTFSSIKERGVNRLSIKQLYSMAYSGQHELVRAKFVEVPEDEREFYNDKEILSQVIWGCLQRINQLKKFTIILL